MLLLLLNAVHQIQNTCDKKQKKKPGHLTKEKIKANNLWHDYWLIVFLFFVYVMNVLLFQIK